MEYLNIVLTIIVTILVMSSDRILFVVRSLLSIITGYWLLKIWEPNVYLLDFREYNLNVFASISNSGLFFKSSLLIGFSYILFYWGIQFIIHNTIGKYFSKKIESVFAELTSTEKRKMRKTAKGLMHSVIQTLYDFRLISMKSISEPMTVALFEESTYKNIGIISHAVLAWFILKVYFGIPFYILLIFIGIVIVTSILAVSTLQELSFIVDDINKFTPKKKNKKNEHNRSNRKIFN